MVILKNEQIDKSVDIFKALADKTRLTIISKILHNEKSVNQIVEEIHMSQSGVSHQLKVLKDVRIVKSRREGKQVLYSLNDVHIERILDQTSLHAREVTK